VVRNTSGSSAIAVPLSIGLFVKRGGSCRTTGDCTNGRCFLMTRGGKLDRNTDDRTSMRRMFFSGDNARERSPRGEAALKLTFLMRCLLEFLDTSAGVFPPARGRR